MKKSGKNLTTPIQNDTTLQKMAEEKNGKISGDLQKDLKTLQSIFGNSEDLIVKDIYVKDKHLIIMYVLGIVDLLQLSKFVVEPLQNQQQINSISDVTGALMLCETEKIKQLRQIYENLCKGKACIFVEGESCVVSCSVDSFKTRSVAEPPTSAVLYGPRVGFCENLKTNLNLVRHILSTPHLARKSIKVGRITHTDISVVYLDNVADKKIVKQIVHTLEKIDIDGIIDSYYIVQYLAQYKYSIFKQIGITEKPDILCAKMLEGRVGILVDGSPIALTLPFVLIEDFQASNDYYQNSKRATFVRFIRILSIFMSIYVPAMYVAVQLFHYKAIPLKFLTTIINSTQGLPFTPFAEMLFILLLFDILYEASLRMPSYLGLAMSIVGALILGDMAVKAGLVSPPAVTVMALSGITIYTIPDQVSQLSLLRLLFVIVGGTLGFFGITILTLYFIIYLNDFDSYSAPYLSPMSPVSFKDMKDSVIKSDISKMTTRPQSISTINKTRQKGRVDNEKQSNN